MHSVTRYIHNTLLPLVAALVVAAASYSCKSTRPVTAPTYDNATGKELNTLDGNELPVQKKLVSTARTWLGTPYVWGGQSKNGTDCSGFVMSVYRDAAGMKLPRVSRDMKKFCTEVSRSDLRVGDLVFFSSKKSEGAVAHVGMYIGHNKFIHSSSSRGVIITDLSVSYYTQHLKGFGRVPAMHRVFAAATAAKTDKTTAARTDKPAKPAKPAKPEAPAKTAPDKRPDEVPPPRPQAVVAVSEVPASRIVHLDPAPAAVPPPVRTQKPQAARPAVPPPAAPPSAAAPASDPDPESMVTAAFGTR